MKGPKNSPTIKEWLGQIEQVGLVVSPHVLVKHTVGIDREQSLRIAPQPAPGRDRDLRARRAGRGPRMGVVAGPGWVAVAARRGVHRDHRPAESRVDPARAWHRIVHRWHSDRHRPCCAPVARSAAPLLRAPRLGVGLANVLLAIGAVWVIIEVWVRAWLLRRRIRTLHAVLTKRFPEVTVEGFKRTTTTLRASDEVAHVMDALYLQSGGGIDAFVATPPPAEAEGTSSRGGALGAGSGRRRTARFTLGGTPGGNVGDVAGSSCLRMRTTGWVRTRPARPWQMPGVAPSWWRRAEPRAGPRWRAASRPSRSAGSETPRRGRRLDWRAGAARSPAVARATPDRDRSSRRRCR